MGHGRALTHTQLCADWVWACGVDNELPKLSVLAGQKFLSYSHYLSTTGQLWWDSGTSTPRRHSGTQIIEAISSGAGYLNGLSTAAMVGDTKWRFTCDP